MKLIFYMSSRAETRDPEIFVAARSPAAAVDCAGSRHEIESYIKFCFTYTIIILVDKYAAVLEYL